MGSIQIQRRLASQDRGHRLLNETPLSQGRWMSGDEDDGALLMPLGGCCKITTSIFQTWSGEGGKPVTLLGDRQC